MVQLAPEIGQRLIVGGVRPQRAADPLPGNRTVRRMKDQECDELLLAPAGQTRRRSAIGNDVEAAEQVDAQGGWSFHVSSLHSPRVTTGIFVV